MWSTDILMRQLRLVEGGYNGFLTDQKSTNVDRDDENRVGMLSCWHLIFYRMTRKSVCHTYFIEQCSIISLFHGNTHQDICSIWGDDSLEHMQDVVKKSVEVFFFKLWQHCSDSNTYTFMRMIELCMLYITLCVS